MKIQILHEEFQQKIATITEYQRAARGLAHTELAKLRLHIKRKLERPEEFGGPMSSMNMTYKSPVDGSYIQYGRRVKSAEEVKDSLELQLNKQYQWLLAEAYEEFEDFVQAAYASAGLYDRSFWPMADFGAISIADVPEKGWDWYQEQSRKKKNTPDSTLARFRAKLPEFAELERKNALEVDLRFELALITQLRHHIVHTSGKVRDRRNFTEKVFTSIGIALKSIPSQESDAIDACFFLPPNEHTIAVLDRMHPDSSMQLPLYVSTFDRLVGAILATAYCLQVIIEKHQALE